LTRTDLSDLAGLPRSTVVHAVRSLIEGGVVVEVEPQVKGPGTGSGRPGTVLRVVGGRRRVIGVDIGHRHVTVAVADDIGTQLACRTTDVDVDADAHAALDLAARLMAELAGEAGGLEPTIAVIGVPLPYDRVLSRVRISSGPTAWSGMDVASELGRRVPYPVRVDNDAILGAYGESKRGAGEGIDDFLFVKVSHGVGAGLILDGRPYRGARGLAGDIGHDKVPGSTDVVRCRRCGGTGCVEAMVSLDAVAGQILQTHPGLSFDDAMTIPVDHITARVLTEAGRTIGRSIAHVCNLLNPSAVIVGGLVAAWHPSFLEGIEWSLRELARPAIAAETRLIAAALGEQSGIVGAVEMAASHAREMAIHP
jgi:predicted NBD/HSP70 family sugar kinase